MIDWKVQKSIAIPFHFLLVQIVGQVFLWVFLWLQLAVLPIATNPQCWSNALTVDRCCLNQGGSFHISCFNGTNLDFRACCEQGGFLSDPDATPPSADDVDCNQSGRNHYIRSDYVHRREVPPFQQESMDPYSIHAYFLAYTYHSILNDSSAYIIDIGCGSGSWSSLFIARSRQVVCLDFGSMFLRTKLILDSFAKSLRLWPALRPVVINMDLEKDQDISDELRHVLPNAIIICAEVIEHLLNPSQSLIPLLNRMLQLGAAVVLLTTPNRDAHFDFRFHRGPPYNEFHVREWNYYEFQAFLLCSGLPLLHHDGLHDTLYSVVAQRDVPPPRIVLESAWSPLSFARSFVLASKRLLVFQRLSNQHLENLSSLDLPSVTTPAEPEGDTLLR